VADEPVTQIAADQRPGGRGEAPACKRQQPMMPAPTAARMLGLAGCRSCRNRPLACPAPAVCSQINLLGGRRTTAMPCVRGVSRPSNRADHKPNRGCCRPVSRPYGPRGRRATSCRLKRGHGVVCAPGRRAADAPARSRTGSIRHVLSHGPTAIAAGPPLGDFSVESHRPNRGRQMARRPARPGPTPGHQPQRRHGPVQPPTGYREPPQRVRQRPGTGIGRSGSADRGPVPAKSA